MLDALNNSPQCNADPACSDGRAKLQQLAAAGTSQTFASAQSVLSSVQRLSALMQSAGASLRSAGINSPSGAQAKIVQMEQGASALAGGSKQLAGGVQTLVDQTKQMGLGMHQAANLLLSIKHDASQPSTAGMYIPPKVLTTNDFKNAAKLFISPDGHSARYLVETKFDPFSTQAMDQVQTILDTARGAQPNTTLSDATISMVGTTPMYSAMRSYYDHDLRLIIVLTLVVVFLILVALLRAIVTPLYLIASVVRSAPEHFDEIYSSGYSNLGYLDVEQRRLAQATDLLAVSLPLTVERDLPICHVWQLGSRARLQLLTNAELAQRLYLSVKTVDHHVSAILMKLAVTGRRDAVRRGRELGILA